MQSIWTDVEEKISHLVVTALGSDRSGLVSEFSKSVFDCGCTIDDSRMIVLGGEFALLVQISGLWNTVAKLESSLANLEKSLGLTLLSHRTSKKQSDHSKIPYAIDVTALDHPGIVYQLASFLSTHDINIEEMNTNTYAAAHTGAPMYSVHIRIWIPASTSIAEIREAFAIKCDELNLDAIFSPIIVTTS